ncbi:Hypothetical predicted protein [Mytilus galloprovincialis]|uniref:TRPM SLOG domain-containing protein n=1 Tax=Mytilus galloprovincialis TaxID=29158 RepID=A0A8B6E307_MYTGA|nr:Hypothetical predicted protein [Mytilus galloprovincialis]
MTSVATRSTSHGSETPLPGQIWENGRMKECQEHVKKKGECDRLLKVTKTKQSLGNCEKEKPVAVLSIIGEAKKYLPNETIKTQLKSGLLELMNTTYIWIITEGQDTCIGQIVEEVIRENTDKSQSCCFHKDDIVRDI